MNNSYVSPVGIIRKDIYIIKNNINTKVYIGQALDSKKRFRSHCKGDYDNSLIDKTIQKYGKEHFWFEILESQIENYNEREKYWIKYYNSYFDGYNSTLGGKLVELYNWDEEDIVQKYYDLKSARKVAKVIGCDHNSVDKILNRHNIKRFTLSESVATANIIIEKNNFKKTFSNTRDCGKWLIDNNYTRSKDINNVTHYLRECLRKNKTYCNFKVYYESKI